MDSRTGFEPAIRVATPDSEYLVHIGPGLLDLAVLAPLLRQNDFSPRCALITNPTIAGYYAERVLKGLRELGFDPLVHEIPDGETSKTLDTVRGIYDRLIDARLDRRSIVLALGGGVVGDIAGFAAATLLRGLTLIQIPTTLLAMVDASIGGKVGVDHPRGKNLVGAFIQPLAVVADVDTLSTLSDSQWRAGMAEVVKHAVIGDSGLFERLASSDRSNVREWLGQAVRVKVNIVERDPFERGERAKLNLGHTFGHAFETVSAYELAHGEAVAIGILCAARLAMRRGLCPLELVDTIEQRLQALGLPTRVPLGISPAAILDAMLMDKKRANGKLRFILPRALGDVVVREDVSFEEVWRAVEDR